jgi:hypothetical protein
MANENIFDTLLAEDSDDRNNEASENTEAVEPEKRQRRIPRGAAPPGLSLGEAVEIATRLCEEAGGEAIYSQLSSITNNSPGSSTFIKKLTALKNYGLVQEEGKANNKMIRLTDDIGFIITAPKSEAERAEALRQAFLRIDLFSKLYEKFKGRLLPQDIFLVNTIADYVPREVAQTWLERFKQSAYAANLLEERSDGKTLVLEAIPTSQPKRQPEPEIKAEQAEERQPQQPQAQPLAQSISDDAIRMPIALGPGRLAHIELPRDWKPTELKKLLAILKLSLGDDSEIPDEKAG